MSLDLEREHVVQSLCAHYAQDHLTTQELERRFEQVYAAADASALRTALHGLPAVSAMVPAPAPLWAMAEQRAAPEEKRYLAMFSEVKKVGRWRPARRIVARAIFGGVTLDLRDAEFPIEGLDLEIDATFGEVKILLPPGVGAEVDGSAMFGEVEDKTHPGAPGSPQVTVRASVLFGSVSVITKLPPEARMNDWRAQVKKFLGM